MLYPGFQNKLTRHKAHWKDCTRCPLCETRRSVVLYRGSIPCDFLLVGEAPGEIEDLRGRPFVGPAGKLLNQILLDVLVHRLKNLRYAITNIVACIPIIEDELSSGKTRAPDKNEAKACKPRLEKFIEICKPRLIVTLGKTAEKYLPGHSASTLGIIHPAAILRMENDGQKDLAIKRATLALRKGLEGIV